MPQRFQQYFFFALLILALVLMFVILKPFIVPLFLALACAVVFQPLHRRILDLVKGRKNIASFLSVFIICFVILIPLLFIGGLLFNETRSLYLHLQESGGPSVNLNIANDTIQSYLQTISPDISFSLKDYIDGFFGWAVGHLDSFFSGFVRVAASLFIMLLALFFILRDGSTLKRNYVTISPLSDQDDELIISSVVRAITSVLHGSLVVSLCQGVLSAVGFAIVGIPNPVLWGAVAALASLVPGVGTSIVTGGGVIYLFLTGNIPMAIVLVLWGSIAVGLVDNLLGPYFVKRGIKIHQFLILLAVFGGLAYFGPIGFLVGPITLSVLYELIALYPKILDNK